MVIYKIIARFGLYSELDSVIATTYKKATELALLWFKNEGCDSVVIAEEHANQETQTFKTYRTYTVKRPF